MSGKTSLERIQENAKVAQDTISILKNELTYINKEYNNMLAKQLREENTRLLMAVEDAKKQLSSLEIQNGTEQVRIPSQRQVDIVSEVSGVSQKEDNVALEPKILKPKKVKPQKDPEVQEAPINIGRLDLRIGKVDDVHRHPNADTLYVLKINCGEEKTRTVCSGLVKFVPIEKLSNRLVLLLCNLKPVKMRGIISEAMIMCASSEEQVEVLIPPPNCVPGDLVHCNGYERQPDAVMNPKKKIFETVVPELHTSNNLVACYKGIPLEVPGKGHCVAESLKNVAVK